MSGHAPAPSVRPVAQKAPVPRLALSVQEACASIGVSWDYWREHVEHELRVVRRGRRKLIAVTELERWLAENGERASA
jgi:excisionase family DNA binding protein